MKIELNFINRSNDPDHTMIAVFQKFTSIRNDAAGSANEFPIAWTVLDHRRITDTRPFVLPLEIPVNYLASSAQQQSGLNHHELSFKNNMETARPPAASDTAQPLEVQVNNHSGTGMLSAGACAAGRLPAATHDADTSQGTAHASAPSIWLGTVAGVTAGDTVDPAQLSQVHTELSLLGIASADIVMTGGGCAPSSAPISFHLENIVLA